MTCGLCENLAAADRDLERKQAKGCQLDLVVFESDEELEYVKKLINCLPEAFWVGYRENNGIAIDILNKVKSGYCDRILFDLKNLSPRQKFYDLSFFVIFYC